MYLDVQIFSCRYIKIQIVENMVDFFFTIEKKVPIKRGPNMTQSTDVQLVNSSPILKISLGDTLIA